MEDATDLDVLDALAANPLYQLSTAGQELFHSNFLYWLANERPHESRALWEVLGIAGWSTGNAARVSREWRHVDLFVDPGDASRPLVLENKVLALPDRDQLVQYHAETSSRLGAGVDAAWVLLSLLQPSFELPFPWTRVSYESLLSALDVVSGSIADAFEQGLVQAYARLVRELVVVRDAFDPVNALEGRVVLSGAVRGRLRAARVLPLVEKLRMSRLAELVAAELRAANLDAPPIAVGLTRTHGMVEMFVTGPRGRRFGWQLQERQFRLAVITATDESGRGTRLSREARIEADHSDYFDFALPAAIQGSLGEYGGNKAWLGFEPNFVYQYRPLAPAITWTQCVALCAHFSARALRLATAANTS